MRARPAGRKERETENRRESDVKRHRRQCDAFVVRLRTVSQREGQRPSEGDIQQQHRHRQRGTGNWLAEWPCDPGIQCCSKKRRIKRQHAAIAEGVQQCFDNHELRMRSEESSGFATLRATLPAEPARNSTTANDQHIGSATSAMIA